MTTEPLFTAIQSTIGKRKAIELSKLAATEFSAVKNLIDLSFHPDQQVGFRSAWILEQVYSNHPSEFMEVGYFLSKFVNLKNPSAQRHFAKILALMTGKKVHPGIVEQLEASDTSEVVDVVFTWLIDDNVPVAVKSHCLNILANFVPKYPWIKDELIQTMDFLVDKESIAFFAKVKQIRKQLRNNRL